MDIGTQIRNLIDQEGITQKQLAEELNISTTTLNGYIYGLTTLREPHVSPYNADERRLVDIYRELPEELKILYEATGRTFNKIGRKKERKREKKGEGQAGTEE